MSMRPTGLRAFIRETSGTVSMEGLLWLPLLAEMALITADVSQAFWRHSEAVAIAHSAVRQVVAQEPADPQAFVDAFVSKRLDAGWTARYFTTGGYRVVQITLPAAKTSLFVTLSDILGNIEATAAMREEA